MMSSLTWGNWWEVVLILVLAWGVFGAWLWPGFRQGLEAGLEEFLKECGNAKEALTRALSEEVRQRAQGKGAWKPICCTWMAQGWGLGRAPVAPGTFGSAGGVVVFLALIAPGSLGFFIATALLGIGLSGWCCGIAERVLRQKDPGSVVLDEIVAMPLCFATWVAFEYSRTGAVPSPVFFLTGWNLVFSVLVFGAFRFFDIAKPWPVRQSQVLPGGWGVTVDDLLAAVYVNLLSLGVLLGLPAR